MGAYWANTSSNSLVGKLIKEGDSETKQTFERLMQGETIRVEIDEQIVYDQLAVKPKQFAYFPEVVVTTSRLFKSEKMDSLLILVIPVITARSK